MSSELQQQLQKLSNSPDERVSILSTLFLSEVLSAGQPESAGFVFREEIKQEL